MNCGATLGMSDGFCSNCGAPVNTAAQKAPAPTVDYSEIFRVELVHGTERRFPLFGETIVVPPEVDVFNYYRKKFSQMAKIKTADLRNEYCARITDLDSFLSVFPDIYAEHRKILIDIAMYVFSLAEYFDISAEQFEEQHTADFCLCGEAVDTVIESFNLTIEANQDKKIRMYNMMPGMVFHGLGGFAAAIAVNAAVNKIAENDIKNADVSSSQREEIYGRINLDVLMENAYIDYWRVFLSLTYELNQRGYGVWYPNEQDNKRASGIYQNLISGRIPQDRVLSQIALLLKCNPYAEGHLESLSGFGMTPEIAAIMDYFSV